jgi:hypothetical protein
MNEVMYMHVYMNIYLNMLAANGLLLLYMFCNTT